MRLFGGCFQQAAFSLIDADAEYGGEHDVILDGLLSYNVTDKISDMAMNGSGVRDTGRVLGISITTVIAHLKNSPHRPSHPSRSTKPVPKPV